MKFIVSIFLIFFSILGYSEEGMIHLDIGRGEARLPIYLMQNSNAIATLILLPGGDAQTGKIIDGKPSSGNFVSRSREFFYAENFNIIVVYRASDLKSLDYPYRINEHVKELREVITFSQNRFRKPVWLIGTSRGSVSATATSIALGESMVQGLVLTSSVTSKKIGAIATQNVGILKMPILVIHHKLDACLICVPSEASEILTRLKSAPIKKFVLIEGGSNPEGDPCHAMHWHGYINFEKETVKTITDWIKNPQN
ncbi:MAG: alpha/beta hydrolase [Polynucleobacter sp.]|jgi:hypothetical protein|nr:alpha/beta hydrolase [Polynucleobacter sp.]